MRVNQSIIRYILGIKVRKFRTLKGCSLSDLSAMSGLSRSYINDIEQGKKYPQADKMYALSQALQVSYDDLVSLRLDGEYAVLNELFLSDRMNDIPLDALGFDTDTLFQMLIKAPQKTQLILNNVANLAWTQDMSRKEFLRSAFLSYKETYNNYFKKIEIDAQDFRRGFLKSYSKFDFESLSDYIKNIYRIEVCEEPKMKHLTGVNSLMIENKKKLILHPLLSSNERKSAILKEIYSRRRKNAKQFKYENNFISDSFDGIFNEMLSDSFALAVLIAWDEFKEDLQFLFEQKTWPAEFYESIKKKYAVDDAMIIRRMGNVLKKEFGINKYTITNVGKKKGEERFYFQLELKFMEHTRAYKTQRNLCKKGIATSIVTDNLKNSNASKFHVQNVRINVNGVEFVFFQISTYVNDAVAGSDFSINLMVLVNDVLKEKIHFLDTLPTVHNGIACESCSIPDCDFRASEPIIIQEREEAERQKKAIDKFVSEY